MTLDITAAIYIGAILGLYRDNGKENGNYYSITGYILGLYRATIITLSAPR